MRTRTVFGQGPTHEGATSPLTTRRPSHITRPGILSTQDLSGDTAPHGFLASWTDADKKVALYSAGAVVGLLLLARLALR